MIRVIKFRVFDGVRFFTPIIDEDGKVYDGHRNYEDGIDSYPNIMQFIGLKDRNGTDVFERDVVEFPNGERYEVTYDEMTASFALTKRTSGSTQSTGFEMLDVHEAEIIGNIHYDPELING